MAQFDIRLGFLTVILRWYMVDNNVIAIQNSGNDKFAIYCAAESSYLKCICTMPVFNGSAHLPWVLQLRVRC